MDNYEILVESNFHTLFDKHISELEDWNSRNINQIAAYLRRNPCVNELDGCRRTVLYRVLLSEKCSLDIVKLLLSHGANVNYRSNFGLSPLNINCYFDLDIDIIKLLLFAGAKVNTTVISMMTFHNDILRVALDFFDLEQCPKRLEVIKVLVKHYVLENSDSECKNFIRRWFRNYSVFEELMSLLNECSREVKVMKSMNISHGSSLFYFVKRRLSSRVSTSGNNPPLRHKEFDKLLGIMAENDFSQYVELIADKVGRSIMLTKLHELDVYALKHHSDSNGMNQKIYLNYDSVCEVMRFLSDADLLRLLIAYSPDKNSGLGYETEYYEYSNKRSLEPSVKDVKKRRKLDE